MSRTSLINLLIGKSIIEAVLVGLLAVFFFFQTFPPYFHGWGEATPASIAGWAVNNAKPWDRVNVQLFIDGAFTANAVANLSRRDVVAAGWAKDEWHGYVFTVPKLPVGRHEARVYAVHESGRRISLQLLGDPIPFMTTSDGSLQDLSGGKRNHVD